MPQHTLLRKPDNRTLRSRGASLRWASSASLLVTGCSPNYGSRATSNEVAL